MITIERDTIVIANLQFFIRFKHYRILPTSSQESDFKKAIKKFCLFADLPVPKHHVYVKDLQLHEPHEPNVQVEITSTVLAEVEFYSAIELRSLAFHYMMYNLHDSEDRLYFSFSLSIPIQKP